MRSLNKMIRMDQVSFFFFFILTDEAADVGGGNRENGKKKRKKSEELVTFAFDKSTTLRNHPSIQCEISLFSVEAPLGKCIITRDKDAGDLQC